MKIKILIPEEIIENKIFLIRGKKVMFDKDLAKLYGVETFNLVKAVKRNKYRFPADFMFQINDVEFKNLTFHFGISSWGGVRRPPYAFTEQGVAMLSSVLNSKRAVETNIQIIRTFTKLREIIISNKELRLKIEEMEKKYDHRFRVVFDTIKKILKTDKKEIEPMKIKGFAEKK